MIKLVLLYWGCVGLMYLSQVYHPNHTLPTHSRHFLTQKGDIYLALAIAWMTCFSFLRTSYNDTGHYITLWNNADPTWEFLQQGGLTKLGGNPLSLLWQSIAHDLSDSYHVYFFLPAIVSSFSAVRFIKRYSADPVLGILIFFSVGTYIMYMAALKQSIAIAILIYALPCAIDKKYVRFYLLVLLAMLFHTHAFIFLAVPFFFGKPWGKVTWLLLAMVFLSMATYDQTFGAFMNFALSLGVNVAEVEIFDGHSIHPLRIVVYAIPALLALIYRNRLFQDSTREENLFANMSIGAVFILTIGLVQGANLFARMAAYYEIAFSITLPWMIHKLFNRRSAWLITIVAAVLFFGYFLYEFGVSKNFGGDYQSISLWQFISALFS